MLSSNLKKLVVSALAALGSRTVVGVAGLLLSQTTAMTGQTEAPKRVVSLGGSVTETVYALGLEYLLVGVDRSSVYPAAARDLPDVGYYRTLSAEGVLSLAPDVVLALEGSGPPEVIRQIQRAGVTVVAVDDLQSLAGVQAKIRRVAEALGAVDVGTRVANSVGQQYESANQMRASITRKPRVLFVWGRGSGSIFAGGTATGAHVMLTLAGATNAVAEMEGYRQITAEAIVASRPDAILIDQATLDGLGGLDGLLAFPGFAATPAGRDRRVLTVDVLAFLGFGPRFGSTIVELLRQLHPHLTYP